MRFINLNGASPESSNTAGSQPRTEVKMEKIKSDILIVGTGPAGASLACFLASHGMPKNLTTPLAATN